MRAIRATKLLLFWLWQSASGHYLWLSENATNDASVTFGETAGVPSPGIFLSMVADKISLSSHDAGGSQNVTLNKKSSGPMHSQLIGHIAAVPPFSLRLSATFGIFHGGSLLRYWSSADVATKPNDWFKIQDWSPRKGLEITIRDPWMNHSFGERINEALLADPGDECKPHQGPSQDGAACVVAVIRFNGELLETGVEIETFTRSGSKLNKTQSQTGVTILKVPLEKTASTLVWARVNYHENVPGKYQGKAYSFVDHWATTFARIQRADNAAIMV